MECHLLYNFAKSFNCYRKQTGCISEQAEMSPHWAHISYIAVVASYIYKYIWNIYKVLSDILGFISQRYIIAVRISLCLVTTECRQPSCVFE